MPCTPIVLLRGAVAYQDMMRKGQKVVYVFVSMACHRYSERVEARDSQRRWPASWCRHRGYCPPRHDLNDAARSTVQQHGSELEPAYSVPLASLEQMTALSSCRCGASWVLCKGDSKSPGCPTLPIYISESLCWCRKSGPARAICQAAYSWKCSEICWNSQSPTRGQI